MKKTLLAIIALATISINGFGQSCTPDPMYADSSFGAWPDTITNFPPAQEGVFYSEVLDFKLPDDAGEIDPTYSGIPVDSAVLTNVIGLPTGLSYNCDVSTCTWYGGQQGCASLFGTPTSTGTHDVVIELDGWVTIPFVGPITQPVTFTGYKIIVSPAAGITIIHKDEFSSAQNSPNPFGEETTIKFTTGQGGDVSLRVMDILGNSVHTQTVNAVPGENAVKFRNSGLANGVYMYTLSNGAKTVTRKMIVRK